MQNENRAVAPSSLPIVVVVGATRPQLRSFGLAVERAGYHVMVIEADRNVVENLAAQQADILVYNLEMGYTAILRGFRALPQQPALILLDADRALPADGFALNEQVYHTAAELEALLRRRLGPTPTDQPQALPVVPETVSTVEEQVPPPPPETVAPASQSEARPTSSTIVPPLVTDAAPTVTRRTPVPVIEGAPTDELPRVRRRKSVPPPRRVRPIVWQTAIVVAAALFLMWAISTSDALRSDGVAAATPVRPTTEVLPDPAASETPLIAPEVDDQAPAAPNLVARVIEVTPAEPTVNDIVNVRVLVENIGTGPALESFWVDLYISPSATPNANQAWPDLSTNGATWFVEGLDAGDEIVLDSLQADPARSNLLRLTEQGTAELFVFVDSYGSTPSGAVAEQNEDNNLFGPYDLFVSR